MEELMLGHVFDKVILKIIDITPEQTMKILVRCKLMIIQRRNVVNIIQTIEKREILLRELNVFVISAKTAEQRLKTNEILREMVLNLNKYTYDLLDKVRLFLNEKKIFGKMFIYDGMDYMKVVVNEMR